VRTLPPGVCTDPGRQRCAELLGLHLVVARMLVEVDGKRAQDPPEAALEVPPFAGVGV
jgi:hypothetical protein